MCYIMIYSVTKNNVSLLIKAKGFDIFPLVCYGKKGTNLFSWSMSSAQRFKQWRAKHTRTDKVEKAVGLLTNEALL